MRQQNQSYKKPLLGPKRSVSQHTAKGKLPSVKNQIRGIERLLKKDDLDPKVRAAKEKQLKELQDKQTRLHKVEREKRLATKYHRIRFFERVKIERQLKKVKRQLQQAQQADTQQQDIDKLQQQSQQLEQDLLYICHFPKGERYVSLLKQGETPEAQQRLESERARLRKLILLQMQEAAVIAEADEGAALAALEAATAGNKQMQAGLQHQQTLNPQEDAEDDDDFFLQSSSGDEAESSDDGGAENAAADQVQVVQPSIKLEKQQQGQHLPRKRPQGRQQQQQELTKAATSAGLSQSKLIAASSEADDTGAGSESNTGDEASGDSSRGTPELEEAVMDISTWLQLQRKRALPLLAGPEAAVAAGKSKQQKQKHAIVQQTLPAKHKQEAGTHNRQLGKQGKFEQKSYKQHQDVAEQQQRQRPQQRVAHAGEDGQQHQQEQVHRQRDSKPNQGRHGTAGRARGGPHSSSGKQAVKQHQGQQQAIKQPLRTRAEGGRKRRPRKK